MYLYATLNNGKISRQTLLSINGSVSVFQVAFLYISLVFFQVGSVFGYRYRFSFFAAVATIHISSVLLICCTPNCTAVGICQ